MNGFFSGLPYTSKLINRKKSKSNDFLWVRIMIGLLAVVYGLAFIMIGATHFREPNKFVDIIPAFLPLPLMLVYISGAMEIAG
ncbi:MAG: hypothetical protein ACKVI6_06795, partial [Candidatus Poseidoniales archaeon]